MQEEYNFLKIEKKWQEFWEKTQAFKVLEIKDKPKYYVLEMFPYPSGRIHMGHLRNYAIGDAVARYKKMQGYNVLHPMGWDAFGLPAENAAIERGKHPQEWTYANIANMKRQLLPVGLSYDWDRELITCSPEYYKHGQKIFIEFLKNGLVTQKHAEVNWDPVDKTVLANEQVIDGKGWRSGAVVEKKQLKQWFIKVTQFADDLYESIKNLQGWPESVRAIQDKWIGKSTGVEIDLKVNELDEKIKIFSTRPETIFGMSFVALSPFHPFVEKYLIAKQEVVEFVAECRARGTSDEEIEKNPKLGIDTGFTIKHPFTNVEVPLYLANFVLMEYGTGAIFGCPSHDTRDAEFASNYGIDMITVISTNSSGKEVIINSDFLNGLSIKEAKDAIINAVTKQDLGSLKVNYRLRDWGVSRQRYWGCPIPIIHCNDCGIVPVPDQDLPVKLPENVDFNVQGKVLDLHPTWKHVSCPICHKDALRETDTLDTFFESSFYFLRFCNPNTDEVFDQDACKYWMNVDQYVGGIEHAALHLLYARFFIRALKYCNYLQDLPKEPFENLLTQGMVLHQTYKDNNNNWLYPEEARGRSDVVIGRVEKMSKSKKNVVDPEDLLQKYGADASRLFMLSDCPPERDIEWSATGIEGALKYLKRLYSLASKISIEAKNNITGIVDNNERSKVHQLIWQITRSTDKMQFNSSIAGIRELTNLVANLSNSAVKIEAVKAIIVMLAPITPHLCEELWSLFEPKKTILQSQWPEVSKDLLVSDIITIAVQINGKLRTTIDVAKDVSKDDLEEQVITNPVIAKYLENSEVKKIIIVPGKIVNVVI